MSAHRGCVVAQARDSEACVVGGGGAALDVAWRLGRGRGVRWCDGRRLPFELRTAAAVVVSVLVIASPARAQSSAGGRWTLDLEPLPVLSSGIGAALRYFPGSRSRFGIGVSGVTQDVDGFAQDVVFDGADALDTRLTWAVGVEALYFLGAAQRGFHVSATAGIEEFRARATEPPQLEDARRNGFASLQLGYVWYPRLGRFFVNPRVGGITTFATDRERTIGDMTYELAPFFPSAWLRLGVRF